MCDFVKSSIQSFYNYKFSRILFVIVHTRKSMKASMYKYGQKAEDLIALRYFAAFQWSVNPVSAETLSLRLELFSQLPWSSCRRQRNMTGRTATWRCSAPMWSEMYASYMQPQVAIIEWIYLPQVKKASAETEPAWKGAGSKVGLQVWRIVKFKVIV